MLIEENHLDPLVTILIPTVNRPDQLPGAVESALGQTYKNLEIIVHDNASDADPTQILPDLSSYGRGARTSLTRSNCAQRVEAGRERDGA